MKKTLLVLLISMVISISLNAQNLLFILEDDVTLEDGKLTAWIIPISEDFDVLLNSFGDYCKERSDIKMKNAGDNLIIAEEVSISNISTNRGDLICQGFYTDSCKALAIAFRLGYDLSLNMKDWPIEMGNLKTYTKEFMSYYYSKSYSDRIEEIEKEIKTIEKEMSSNENQIKSLGKKVASLDDKINKETDATKVEELTGEKKTLQAEIDQTSEMQPRLRSNIEELTSKIEKLKNESLQLQNSIGSL